MSLYLDTDLVTDRNGFTHCTVCGGDNDGEGNVSHLMVGTTMWPEHCPTEDATDQADGADVERWQTTTPDAVYAVD